ncbi:hypothetical protein ACFVQB_19470 [Paenibacillus sp. NPDC057886]|uniref:hypothetical protein n=1 Tax=Paenibacillus sp. NPDC057886 TaxID=3346270 RepID=UPI00368715CC
MQKRMEPPPSLLELSRLVGISDSKLKSGFKELFGTTVFGYLKEKRLDKARELLEMSKYLIAQMNGGNFEGRSVLSKPGINRMHEPAARIKQGEYYGMGWIISDSKVWHNGTTENSSSYLVMDGEYGIVLLFNSVDFFSSYDY